MNFKISQRKHTRISLIFFTFKLREIIFNIKKLVEKNIM